MHRLRRCLQRLQCLGSRQCLASCCQHGAGLICGKSKDMCPARRDAQSRKPAAARCRPLLPAALPPQHVVKRLWSPHRIITCTLAPPTMFRFGFADPAAPAQHAATAEAQAGTVTAANEPAEEVPAKEVRSTGRGPFKCPGGACPLHTAAPCEHSPQRLLRSSGGAPL